MINDHPLKNFIVCKNDFFKNPDKILNLFDKQEFFHAHAYPGKRTNNLLESKDDETRNFALFFVQKVCDEIFPGIHELLIDVRFHINTAFDVDAVNEGWIHCDEADLAGLVYMSPEEFSLSTGTSMFAKKTVDEFAVSDYKSRQNFNFTEKITEEYIHELKDNHNNFVETLRVGNVYNRLIAYDGRIFHRPNRYKLESNEPRKSIVFFIRGFKKEYTPKVRLNFRWEDV
jgi:hypothetical protein